MHQQKSTSWWFSYCKLLYLIRIKYIKKINSNTEISSFSGQIYSHYMPCQNNSIWPSPCWHRKWVLELRELIVSHIVIIVFCQTGHLLIAFSRTHVNLPLKHRFLEKGFNNTVLVSSNFKVYCVIFYLCIKICMLVQSDSVFSLAALLWALLPEIK